MLTEDRVESNSMDAQQSKTNQSACFNDWLSRQTRRKDLIGKFARSVKADECWPLNVSLDKEDEYLLLRNHIRTYHFSHSYPRRVSAFEIAWEEYQNSLTPQLRRSLSQPTVVATTSSTTPPMVSSFVSVPIEKKSE
ncbi:MAG TPA: YozE family protein [Nitrososphaerales archaeon]|nr:YozE family protein [Nitrososphaerales archaeon]